MQFYVAAVTDIGIYKQVNQDSLNVMVADTKIGQVAMMVMCDGIGGLSLGEVASSQVVLLFKQWFVDTLPSIIDEGITDIKLECSWKNLINNADNSLKEYTRLKQVKLGTTLTAMLLIAGRYHIVQIGDSRAYEITHEIRQLTEDQTVAEQEIRLGHITEEQARNDSRKHILLQCIGAGERLEPQYIHGDILNQASYIVCTDGFYNRLEAYEIQEKCSLQPGMNREKKENKLHEIIESCKSRGERDNISVIWLHTTA